MNPDYLKLRIQPFLSSDCEKDSVVVSPVLVKSTRNHNAEVLSKSKNSKWKFQKEGHDQTEIHNKGKVDSVVKLQNWVKVCFQF